MSSNFRRHRPHPRHEKVSTDGFIRASDSSAHHKIRRGNAYQPIHRNPRVGNFRSSDGFHPAGRTNRIVGDVRTAHPLGRQPERNASGHIQLDAPHPEHKKKLRWYKRLQHHLLFNPFRRSNWTKKRAMSSFAMVAIMVVGAFAGLAWWNANKIFQGGGGAAALQENVDPALLRGEGDGRVNILLAGRGGEGHEGADLTDTLIIASINPIQKEAALLSIPRDLYVQTSGGSYSKINAVFANAKDQSLANSNSSDRNRMVYAEAAGMKALEDVLSAKMGIPIHYHGIIDFEGFRKAVDTVGGVDVNVPESGEVYEPMMRIMGVNYNLNVQKGWSHFNGLRALAYTRSRYTSPRGDFDRSERQRLILVALKNKVISAGTYGNPWKISQLMDNFGDHVRTNLSLEEVMRLYEIGNTIESKNIASVGLADPPNNFLTTSFLDGQSVVIPRAGIDNYKEIQFFIRNRMKDGFLVQENATVAIYNGTAIEGLAGRTAEDLKSYGYKISKVANSPNKGVQKTILVDLRNGEKKYTKRYLENRFGVTVVNSMPFDNIDPGDADFVIILGQNEQTRLAN